MFGNVPIRQVAYFVPDIREAAKAHRALFGSGPFLVIDHVPTPTAFHRGRETPLDHGSAYGQWGPIMVEFVQQHNPDPSAFHDMYPWGSGRGGLHHLAIFVDRLDEALRDFSERGFETALYAVTHGGTAFAMVDLTEPLGHMMELYEPTPALTGFYEQVAGAANADPEAPAFVVV